MVDQSASDLHMVQTRSILQNLVFSSQQEYVTRGGFDGYAADSTFCSASSLPIGVLSNHRLSNALAVAGSLPRLHEVKASAWAKSCLSRPMMQWCIPPAVAPPIRMTCSNRAFMDRDGLVYSAVDDKLALYGLPPSLLGDPTASRLFEAQLNLSSPIGVYDSSPSYQTSLSIMQVPDGKRLIYDSAKLARLDLLLQELKTGDHKVLIYFQMTKMMDLMEEYLIYRQHKYLRLDGSSKLEDRRDMVMDWQTRPDIFVFLLSTRAGGLGINLTAADTVIFYDHDWNPSNDSQAMDRAHRLGQTRQVTVYRLITKGTIDERIIQLARVKKDVQDIVVGNKQLMDIAKPSEIVSLLLNDDEIANLGTTATFTSTDSGNQTSETLPPQTRDLWVDDGDDFFGASSTANDNAAINLQEDKQNQVVAKAPAKRGRKPGRGRGTHRKKPGPATGDSLPADM